MEGDIAELKAQTGALERELAALSVQVDDLTRSSERFDAFLEGLRMLLMEVEMPSAEVTPLRRQVGTPTAEPEATATPVPTRTPWETPTPPSTPKARVTVIPLATPTPTAAP